MTDRELKKLSRSELLELLFVQTEEAERLEKELQYTRTMLKDRRLYLTEPGNIAEAALRMNEVFEAAQAAADQYLDNIAEMERRSREECERMLKQTREECENMIRQAQQDADRFWAEVREQMDAMRTKYPDSLRWQELMRMLSAQIPEQVQG